MRFQVTNTETFRTGTYRTGGVRDAERPITYTAIGRMGTVWTIELRDYVNGNVWVLERDGAQVTDHGAFMGRDALKNLRALANAFDEED